MNWRDPVSSVTFCRTEARISEEVASSAPATNVVAIQTAPALKAVPQEARLPSPGNDATREELFRAAHDIKGDATTFGYPSAGAAAESLCRIVEHAPDLSQVPPDLIAHHINAIQAIVRERTKLDTASMASELSKQLRGVADVFLTHANRDRPEHLEAILAPSIVPAE